MPCHRSTLKIGFIAFGCIATTAFSVGHAAAGAPIVSAGRVPADVGRALAYAEFAARGLRDAIMRREVACQAKPVEADCVAAKIAFLERQKSDRLAQRALRRAWSEASRALMNELAESALEEIQILRTAEEFRADQTARSPRSSLPVMESFQRRAMLYLNDARKLLAHNAELITSLLADADRSTSCPTAEHALRAARQFFEDIAALRQRTREGRALTAGLSTTLERLWTAARAAEQALAELEAGRLLAVVVRSACSSDVYLPVGRSGHPVLGTRSRTKAL